MTERLKFISIQSPNADESCRLIADQVGRRLGVPVEFVGDVSWQERDQMLNEGSADVGWICGLPYVKKMEQYPRQFELIAAPVMQHKRYQQRPVYYSDVVVHHDSPFDSFDDLRGTRWAYNEPNSQSGYNITRYHLAELNERVGFFGRVIEAGSHLNAIDLVLDGEIEAAAIDSTVLELASQNDPKLHEKLRIVEVLGPSPIPPWVINTAVPKPLREAIKRVFWTMHMTAEGRDVLAAGHMNRMVAVNDRDYDRIREMARKAEKVRW